MYRGVDDNSIIPEIKYIPQNYLIRLAEPDQNKKGADLNKIVRELINEDEESKNAYDSFLSIVKSNDKKREAIIDNYFETLEKISELERELKTKSSADVLHQSIKANTDRVKRLNEIAGLSPEQIEQYDELQKKLETLKSARSNALADYKKITDFNNELIDALKSQKIKEELLSTSLQTPEFKNSFDTVTNTLTTTISSLISFGEKFVLVKNQEGASIFKLKSEISDFFTKNSGDRKAIEKDLEPFLKNEAIKKEIEEIVKSISTDKAALLSIAHLTKEINDNKKILSDSKLELFTNYEENFKEYNKIIDELKSRTINLEQDGLKIEGLVKFNIGRFQKNVFEFSDGRKANYKDYDICSEERKNLDDFKLKEVVGELLRCFLR